MKLDLSIVAVYLFAKYSYRNQQNLQDSSAKLFSKITHSLRCVSKYLNSHTQIATSGTTTRWKYKYLFRGRIEFATPHCSTQALTTFVGDTAVILFAQVRIKNKDIPLC